MPTPEHRCGADLGDRYCQRLVRAEGMRCRHHPHESDFLRLARKSEALTSVTERHIGGDNPCDPHSWRCYDKVRYPGPCGCAEELSADILAAIAQPGPAQDAVIAALIEGGVLREEFNAEGEEPYPWVEAYESHDELTRERAEGIVREYRDGRVVVRLVTEWRAEA